MLCTEMPILVESTTYHTSGLASKPLFALSSSVSGIYCSCSYVMNIMCLLIYISKQKTKTSDPRFGATRLE